MIAMPAFSIAGMAFEARGWPEEWLQHAKRWPRIAPEESLAPIRVVRESRRARGPAGPARVALTQKGLRLHTDQLDATFSFGEGTLVLCSSMSQSPRLTLENALRLLVSSLLPLRHDGLMLHGAAGVLDGSGLVFAGVSTAGKTTLSLGFRKARYISDDISLLNRISTSPRLLSSPFFGAAGKAGENLESDLRAISILRKAPPGARTTLQRLHGAKAVAELMPHVVLFGDDRSLMRAALERVSDLVKRVPVFSLSRSLEDPSDEVARLVLEAAS